MDESFYEKCDRVLIYLKRRPSPFKEITTFKIFTSETGVLPSDNVLIFLRKDKGFIEYTSYDISITSLGVAFISSNSFHKEEINETELKQLNIENIKLQTELSKLQIREIKGKRKWAVIGAISASLLTLVIEHGKDILSFLNRLFHR